MARISHDVLNSSSHLFCFSHLRWGFVYQRPQHLMSRAAREFRTWYFEEPCFVDGPSVLRIQTDNSNVSVVTPLLPRGIDSFETYSALRTLLGRLIGNLRPRRLIAWYYTPMALRFTSELEPDRCVYDNMDELSSFACAPEGILEMEQRLMSRCDVVYVGGRSLYDAKKDRHNNIHVFPSSVDGAHFRQAREPQIEPPDQGRIPHPRIGFFGVIDERMNLEIVRGIAALRPDWHLVMIGPTAKIDPADLPRASNIHWLGCKDYSALPNYLAGWNAGFMPFALNESTRFISPTKTPEFLAAGIPVVSTPIADVVDPYGRAGHVEIAADALGFVSAIEKMMGRPKRSWLKRIDAHLAEMSWDDTWAGMRRHLDFTVPQTRSDLEARRV